VKRSCRSRRVAVVGIGNLLMMDDGVGIHALRRLERQCRDDGAVSLVDGGTNAWGALWQARDCDRLILLDAVRGGRAPGTVYRFGLDGAEPAEVGMSLHDVSLPHLVRLESALTGGFESAEVVGMEPGRVEPAIGLSEPCMNALPALVRAAQERIREVMNRDQIPGAQPC